MLQSKISEWRSGDRKKYEISWIARRSHGCRKDVGFGIGIDGQQSFTGAKILDISVQAKFHKFDGAIPNGVADQFGARDDSLLWSWGQIVGNRVSGQGTIFGSTYASGSMITGWKGN